VIEEELGEGSYGKVYSGRWKNAHVALKFCRKKKGVDNFLKEIQIMMYVSHSILTVGFALKTSFVNL
jgi:predicted Ser/Thr protein kinase